MGRILDTIFSVLGGIFFGPWFYLNGYFQDSPLSSQMRYYGILAMVVIFVAVRIFLWRRRKKFRTSLLIAAHIFFAGIWLGMLGGLANCIVEIKNGFMMPAVFQYIKAIIPASGAIRSQHVVANADTKILWLSDYIQADLYPSINFFFHGRLVSPGDLALICCFLLVYVFPLAWVGSRIFFCAAKACHSPGKRYF